MSKRNPTTPPKDAYRVAETMLRVRFAETDAMGVVHHAAYIVYLEEGRSDLGRQFGVPYASLENAGYSLPVTELSARFLASARYDDQIMVRTWISQLQSRGITYEYEIVNGKTREALVTASTKHICTDRTARVRRLPANWFEALNQQRILR